MNALAVVEADAAAANTARRNDPYTSPATIKACAKESAAARAAIAELIEAASAAEFHLTREHRAPMTVDAADYVTEVERDRNKLRAAHARVGGGK